MNSYYPSDISANDPSAPWNWKETKISYDVQYWESGKGWIFAENFDNEEDAIEHAQKIARTSEDVRVLKFVGDDEEKLIWVGV